MTKLFMIVAALGVGGAWLAHVSVKPKATAADPRLVSPGECERGCLPHGYKWSMGNYCLCQK